MNIEEFKLILKEFDNIPNEIKFTSIFNIAGYPHYENVASNILSFFFNPNNEHHLKGLLLDSLVEIIDKKILDYKTVAVYREVSTIKNGRLDILIESEKQIIGIENKIYHHLNNDLEDYSKTIDNLAKEENKETIKIILSTKKEMETNNFLSITYKDFLLKIRENLGKYTSSASQKWLLYLLDFMQTIDELLGDNMEFSEKDKFFIENIDRVNKLLNAQKEFFIKLNRKTVNLYNIIEIPSEYQINKWIFRKNCLVIDLNLSGYNIAFDFYIGTKKCELQLFGREEKDSVNRDYLDKIIPYIQELKEKKNGRYTIKIFDLNTDNNTLKVSLEKWIYKIIQAEKIYKGEIKCTP